MMGRFCAVVGAWKEMLKSTGDASTEVGREDGSRFKFIVLSEAVEYSVSLLL